MPSSLDANPLFGNQARLALARIGDNCVRHLITNARGKADMSVLLFLALCDGNLRVSQFSVFLIPGLGPVFDPDHGKHQRDLNKNVHDRCQRRPELNPNRLIAAATASSKKPTSRGTVFQEESRRRRSSIRGGRGH